MGKQLLFIVSITDGQQRSALSIVSSLNKKLVSMGLAPVQSVMKKTTASRISVGAGYYSVRRWSMLIFGKTPSIDGWSINSVVERSIDGAIEVTRLGRSHGEMRDSRYHRDIVCEICNEKRDRRRGYLLTKNGVTKSVGESCMSTFFKFKPTKSIYLLQNLAKAIKELKEISCSRTNLPSGLTYIPIKPFMQYVLALIEIKGYVPKSHGGKTTGSEAANWYLRNGIPDANPGNICIHSGTLDKSKYHLKEEQSLNIINWAAQFSPTDSYSSNIKKICEDGWVSITQVNLAASVYEAYEKHLSRIRQNVQCMTHNMNENSTILESLEMTLRCARITKVETRYGTRFLHHLYDTEGNEYGLFKSKPILSKGAYYNVRAMTCGSNTNCKDGVKRMIILRRITTLSECRKTTS